MASFWADAGATGKAAANTAAAGSQGRSKAIFMGQGIFGGGHSLESLPTKDLVAPTRVNPCPWAYSYPGWH
ncbi:hypothetical protein GCM10027345_11120 [Hymenobacter daeguensis]